MGHGPVVPTLYRSFKQHGAQPIPRPEGLNLEEFTSGQISLLDEVYVVYGQFSASKLRRMTHEEPPRKETYSAGPSCEISRNSMQSYFSTLVNVNEVAPKA